MHKNPSPTQPDQPLKQPQPYKLQPLDAKHHQLGDSAERQHEEATDGEAILTARLTVQLLIRMIYYIYIGRLCRTSAAPSATSTCRKKPSSTAGELSRSTPSLMQVQEESQMGSLTSEALALDHLHDFL